MKISECIPIVSVSSIEAAKSFFVDLLGLTIDFEVDAVVGLLHGSVLIYCIAENSENNRQPAGSANLNFMMDEVDELYSRCVTAHVEILVEPDHSTYCQLDFAVLDQDVNVIVFSCGL